MVMVPPLMLKLPEAGLACPIVSFRAPNVRAPPEFNVTLAESGIWLSRATE